MNKAVIKNIACALKKWLENSARNLTDHQAVIEDIAYDWFKYLICVAYMEFNNYLPQGVRPVILHSHQGNLRENIINQWKLLHEMLPDYFNPPNEDGYPKNAENIIAQLIDTKQIPLEDWQHPEILGWLYQYYFSDKHQQVAGINNGRIQEEDIPAATQLFTPKWIVQYMIDNSLGRYWIEATGDDRLREVLPFYIPTNREGQTNICPREIKLLDPACGTGHILFYAYDVLYEIYIRTGISQKEIPHYIINHNLYGLDIDERTVTLCRFGLLMKMRQRTENIYDRLKYTPINWNILEIKKSDNIGGHDWMPQALNESFKNGKLVGSLLNVESVDTAYCMDQLEKIKGTQGLKDSEVKNIEHMIRQTEIMQLKYDVVVSNPPYMSNKMMPDQLKAYVDQNYKAYRGDLFSVFMKRCLEYTKPMGYTAFMTPFVWMFIKTYEGLRKYIIENKTIVSLVQLQYSGFEGATVPVCTFVLQNGRSDCLGEFFRLSDFKGFHNQPLRVLDAIKNNVSYRYQCPTKAFKEIPGLPIAYWASDSMREVFHRGIPLRKIAAARVGLQTSDNKRFVRAWYEVPPNKIGFACTSREDALESKMKWFPYNKGGHYRKWYGNHMHVVNWEKDGEEIRAFNEYLNSTRASNIGIANTQFYFREGITWSFVSSSYFGVRFTEEGFIFDTAGSTIFPEKNRMYYLLGLLCSKVSPQLLHVINPTLNFQPGNLAQMPIILSEEIEVLDRVESLVKDCIAICKEDWNEYEISWDFHVHPILKHRRQSDLVGESYDNWQLHTNERFQRIMANEVELNGIFIKIYGLEKEIKPEIETKEITLRGRNIQKDIRSLLSYAVGCILGRYDRNGRGFISDGLDYSDGFHGEEMGSEVIRFIERMFGSKTCQVNMQYIADILERKPEETAEDRIKRYFINEFYHDHLKVYQKKPIYWLFSSGKQKSFHVYVYYHRIDMELLKGFCEKVDILRKKLVEDKILISLEGITQQIPKYNNIEINLHMEELLHYNLALKRLIDAEGSIDWDVGINDNYKRFQPILQKL